MGSERQHYDQSPEVLQQGGGLEVHHPQGHHENANDPSAYLNPKSAREHFREEHPPGRRIPFGLRPLAFACLVALATLIVVGAALGGGLGGALAATRQPSSTQAVSTVTKTVTASSSPISTSGLYSNFTVPEPQSVLSLATVCPAKNNQQYTTLRQEIFTYTCGEFFLGGTPGAGGGVMATYAGFVAYTIEDCIGACSNMNAYTSQVGTGPLCRAITFQPLLNMSYTIDFGSNCWLFNTTGQTVSDVTSVSAVLES